MNLYELFILGVNIKYIVLSIIYSHINVPMACKKLTGHLLCLMTSTPQHHIDTPRHRRSAETSPFYSTQKVVYLLGNNEA